MNQFAQALGSKFIEHKEEIRIRSFELGGHTFKVKVPLTSEYELMQKKMNIFQHNKTFYNSTFVYHLENIGKNPSRETNCSIIQLDIYSSFNFCGQLFKRTLHKV